MHSNILPNDTKNFLSLLGDHEFIHPFYLSGGTGLALHLGHRESEDLDFFSQKQFDPVQLQVKLQVLGFFRTFPKCTDSSFTSELCMIQLMYERKNTSCC